MAKELERIFPEGTRVAVQTKLPRGEILSVTGRVKGYSKDGGKLAVVPDEEADNQNPRYWLVKPRDVIKIETLPMPTYTHPKGVLGRHPL